MFLLDFFHKIQLQGKYSMWFAAFANWKVETSVVQTTAHAKEMIYRAYLHAKADTELLFTTARKFQTKMMLMIIWDFRWKYIWNNLFFFSDYFSEAVVQRCSVKKVRPANLLKKRLWYRCFPVNFVKFLRTLFFIQHLWWLLLIFVVNSWVKIQSISGLNRISSKGFVTLSVYSWYMLRSWVI